MRSKKRFITLFIVAAFILSYSAVKFIFNEGMKDAQKTKAASAVQRK